MSNILSFTDRLNAKLEAEENQRLQQQFITEIFSQLTHEQKLQLVEIMENGDEAGYRALTEPIIMRNAIRKDNN